VVPSVTSENKARLGKRPRTSRSCSSIDEQERQILKLKRQLEDKAEEVDTINRQLIDEQQRNERLMRRARSRSRSRSRHRRHPSPYRNTRRPDGPNFPFVIPPEVFEQLRHQTMDTRDFRSRDDFRRGRGGGPGRGRFQDTRSNSDRYSRGDRPARRRRSRSFERDTRPKADKAVAVEPTTTVVPDTASSSHTAQGDLADFGETTLQPSASPAAADEGEPVLPNDTAADMSPHDDGYAGIMETDQQQMDPPLFIQLPSKKPVS